MTAITPSTKTIVRLFIITAICLLWGNDASTSHPLAPYTVQAQTDFDCTTVSEIPQIECEALVGPRGRRSSGWDRSY